MPPVREEKLVGSMFWAPKEILKLDLVIRSEAFDKKHTGGHSRHCFCSYLSKVLPTPSNQSASIDWEPFIFQFAININVMLLFV